MERNPLTLLYSPYLADAPLRRVQAVGVEACGYSFLEHSCREMYRLDQQVESCSIPNETKHGELCPQEIPGTGKG